MANTNTGRAALRGASQGAAVANASALTSAAAVGANPTKAEFDKTVDDLAALRTKLNAALTALRNAGIIAT